MKHVLLPDLSLKICILLQFHGFVNIVKITSVDHYYGFICKHRGFWNI